MKLFSIVFSIVCLAFFSCNHKKALSHTEGKDSDGNAGYYTIANQNKANINLKNVYIHSFSDTTKKDTFKLNLTGKNILDSKVVFEIIDFKGKRIYKNEFTGLDLLGDLTDGGLTKKQEEDTIRAVVKGFFNNEDFDRPAIDKSDTLDTDNSEKSVWEDIKSDPTAIGFIYSYGYEGTYGIAYSKKKKKVVEYFYSD